MFTGFAPAVSRSALARMSETVRSWRLDHHLALTWNQLALWIGPVIRGWMNYYGRYHRSGLYSLLARINWHIIQWLRAKYRRFRGAKALGRAWDRATARHPNARPHWQWVTWIWR